MFDFDAVVDMERKLGEYARNQQNWAEATTVPSIRMNAERRLRKAAAARRALRAFLRSTESGQAALDAAEEKGE